MYYPNELDSRDTIPVCFQEKIHAIWILPITQTVQSPLLFRKIVGIELFNRPYRKALDPDEQSTNNFNDTDFMVTSPTRHCLDVGNDELIILLCSGGITRGLKRDVGKGGGGVEGGFRESPSRSQEAKQTHIS